MSSAKALTAPAPLQPAISSSKTILPRGFCVVAAQNLQQRHKELLYGICPKMGQSESEALRIAFLQYAEKLSLITEKVCS